MAANPLDAPRGSDPIDLADWVELQALTRADRNVSGTDLRRAIVSLEGDGSSDEDLERRVDETFSELSDRARSAHNAYPFSLKNSLIEASTQGWRSNYVFLLLITTLRDSLGVAKANEFASLFEDVSVQATKTYLNGEAFRFGWPRRSPLPPSFDDAVEHLCKSLGEGSGCRRGSKTPVRKDDSLDVVAWKPHKDGRTSQLILFGQCATGANWRDKLTELQPSSFVANNLLAALSMEPNRAFFTPWRVPADGWLDDARKAGILFDRCRISHLVGLECKDADVLAALDEMKKSIVRRSMGSRRATSRRAPSARRR